MAETATNIPIDSETWINARDVSCSPVNVDLSIQNIGVTDLYYSIKVNQPARDSDSYRIFRRGETIKIEKSSVGVWVFSPQVNGLINVECLDFKKLTNENEITLLNLNYEIISLLKAILMGVEMIADQEEGSLIEDINED